MNIGKVFKKYFVPTIENDHKPYFLRGECVSVLIAIIVILELGVVGQAYFVSTGGSSYLASVLSAVLVDLTNTERAKNDAAPLTTNPQLQEAAQLKANDMAAKSYFSHNTPEGYTPWYWLDKVGYTYDYAGENLAINFFDSADVENAWMNSPGHRANIVKTNYTQIGIATATGTYQGKNTIFVVQFFGTPKTIAAVATTTAVSVATAASSTPAKITTAPKKTPVAEIAARTGTSSVLSASIAPAQPAESSVQKTQNTIVNKVITSPHTTETTILEILLGLVGLALIIAVAVEIKIQHPKIILNGLGLLVAIALIILLNNHLFQSYTTITTPDEVTAGSTTSHS